MKKLLTIVAGALAIAWIAVPVAGAADVNGSSWSSLRPGASAGSTSLRPHDVYQTSSWNRVHLRQTADVNERG